MSTFTWAPAPGSSQSKAPRVKTAQFGDGYSQRAGDGINTIKRAWSVTFTRATADIDAIDAFLTARAGVESFDWTPPTGAAGKWICPEWGRDKIHSNVQAISTSFVEVFGD